MSTITLVSLPTKGIGWIPTLTHQFNISFNLFANSSIVGRGATQFCQLTEHLLHQGPKQALEKPGHIVAIDTIIEFLITDHLYYSACDLFSDSVSCLKFYCTEYYLKEMLVLHS